MKPGVVRDLTPEEIEEFRSFPRLTPEEREEMRRTAKELGEELCASIRSHKPEAVANRETQTKTKTTA